MPAMLSMGMGNKAPAVQLWAADSGRYNNPAGYTDEKYLAFLTRHQWAVERCLFATAPDVVGDARATLALSAPMYEQIRALGYKVALVAQDGQEKLVVPWGSFDALFIGGTTAFKTSEHAMRLCSEARARGKWVHMGRVNSRRRIELASDFGCDSVDGTHLTFEPDAGAVRVRKWMDDAGVRLSLWKPEERASEVTQRLWQAMSRSTLIDHTPPKIHKVHRKECGVMTTSDTVAPHPCRNGRAPGMLSCRFHQKAHLRP